MTESIAFSPALSMEHALCGRLILLLHRLSIVVAIVKGNDCATVKESEVLQGLQHNRAGGH